MIISLSNRYLGQNFFGLSDEIKNNYVHPMEQLGRDNRGYVAGDVREYVKYRPGDPPFCWPNEVPNFEACYRSLFDKMYTIAWRCFVTLATTPIPINPEERRKHRRRGPSSSKDSTEKEERDESKDNYDGSEMRSLMHEREVNGTAYTFHPSRGINLFLSCSC